LQERILIKQAAQENRVFKLGTIYCKIYIYNRMVIWCTIWSDLSVNTRGIPTTVYIMALKNLLKRVIWCKI